MKKTLLEFLLKGPAHAPIRDILKDLDPKIRHEHIDERIKTIWEELEHMRLAQKDILNYMTDPDWVSPDWPAGYWPESKENRSENEWQVTVSGFRKDLEYIGNFISTNNIDLNKPIPHVKQHTYLREILLIIDHNAYHSGKIVLIRKYFANWPG